MKKILVIMAVALVSLSVSAKGKKMISFTVEPRMVCTNCENKIKSNLRFEKGVKMVDTSLSEQEVTITYDPDKTNEEKLVEAFGKIGYQATVMENEESGNGSEPRRDENKKEDTKANPGK